MKKQYITLTLVGSLFAVSTVLMSNSNGPGGNRTGAPGASGDCSGCHYAGKDPNGSLTVTLMDGQETVTSYEAGKTYDVKVTLKGSSNKMGFQLSAIDASNNQAGELSSASSGSTIYKSGNQQIWGHSSPGNNTDENTWTAKWTAPDVDEVTVYSAGILANSNKTNSGDNIEKTNVTFTKKATSSLSFPAKSRISLIQNPVTDEIKLNQQCKSLVLWNSKGQMITSVNNTDHISTKQLPSGLYHLNTLSKNGVKKTIHVIVE